MKNISKKLIFWVPRVLSILFILFLALFSLDVFSMNLDFWQTFGALFMHNIPSIVLAILLAISWKYEIVGAITFILAGLLYVFRTLITTIMNSAEWYYISYAFILAGPAFLIGILFLIGWWKKKK